MVSELSISGTGFIGESYTPENVEIIIEDNRIKEINPSKKESTDYILPAFFNAHTHLGDTVALDTPIDRPLAELVAPPDGLKHQILRATSPEKLRKGMVSSLIYMYSRGTLGFADFREGGPDGVQNLKNALNPGLHMAIFGRDGGELLPCSCGLGLSSAHDSKDEAKAVQNARLIGKKIAVHAGEGSRKDIEAAFSLEPDIIIHATHFDESDILRARDEGITVTVCPRSNWVLNVTDSASKPPVRKLLDAGVNLTLGTDNAMFVPTDMFGECAFLMTVYKISAEDALHMATSGFNILGINNRIEVGNPANLTIVDGEEISSWSKHPLSTILTRIGSKGVKKVISSINSTYNNH